MGVFLDYKLVRRKPDEPIEAWNLSLCEPVRKAVLLVVDVRDVEAAVDWPDARASVEEHLDVGDVHHLESNVAHQHVFFFFKFPIKFVCKISSLKSYPC